MDATKKPTRDYLSYSDTPWGLWDVIYARRSHRKYLPLELDSGFIRSLEDQLRVASSVRGAKTGSILLVTDRNRVEGIKRRANKGVPNKVNSWLPRIPVAGFLVLVLPLEDVESDRPQELPLTGMAAEDAVLWLTEAGLGTCWLSGVDQGEIKDVLGLGKDMAVPAIIPFGKPKPKAQGLNYDHLTYWVFSTRRKPLPKIASMESMEHPYPMGGLAKKPFSASPVQDIAGLLERISDKSSESNDAPVELVIDACLEAGRVAPSGTNAQAWHFIVVTGEERLRELEESCEDQGGWRTSIVAAGHPGGFDTWVLERPFWMIDTPIALSHMSLMAASMGSGVSMHINGYDENSVNKLVGLPSRLRTVGILGIR